MEEKKLIDMINLFVDGELNKREEVNLFSLLASNRNGREYLKKLSLIRNAVDESIEEIPDELEKRILRSAGLKSNRKAGLTLDNKMFSAIAYAVTFILLFLSGYLFLKVTSYEEKVDNLSQQMMIQSKTIQMLYNSLPGVEIRATFDNEIVVKPNI